MRHSRPLANCTWQREPGGWLDHTHSSRSLARVVRRPSAEYQRIWWNSNADNTVYEGLEDTIKYLDEFWETQGPFDGILGFSQGGALAGILAALQPKGHIKFDFLINASGFISRAHEHQALLQPNALRMPSFHIYGKTDILVDPERTRAYVTRRAPFQKLHANYWHGADADDGDCAGSRHASKMRL